MQLQYQLMRAFGRVLGLGWSQTNDNVFTGSSAGDFQPGDELAGDASDRYYLRARIRISACRSRLRCARMIFRRWRSSTSSHRATAPPGKTDSLLNANQFLWGAGCFPTGRGCRVSMCGAAMGAVHVYVGRSRTGTRSRRSPALCSGSRMAIRLRGRTTSFDGSQGMHGRRITKDTTICNGFRCFRETGRLSFWRRSRSIRCTRGNMRWDRTRSNTVDPSGTDPVIGRAGSRQLPADVHGYLLTVDPANSCNTPTDGTKAAPAAVNAQGWWQGTLCGYGHSAWSSLEVKGNRSLTLEVTAEDEQGFATIAKAMPVIGVWNATDPRGSLPGVASAGEAFNGHATGMTTLTTSFTQPDQLRIAIADQRGDGRPDFNYQARVLYADSVTPSALSAAGGTITITGMGFRTGNAVFVNGLLRTVLSWSANTIVASAPSLHAAGFKHRMVADVTVEDLSTGGTTVMTSALSYAAPAAVAESAEFADGYGGRGATGGGSICRGGVAGVMGSLPVAGGGCDVFRIRRHGAVCGVRRGYMHVTDECSGHCLYAANAGVRRCDYVAGDWCRWNCDCFVHCRGRDEGRDRGAASGVCCGGCGGYAESAAQCCRQCCFDYGIAGELADG